MARSMMEIEDELTRLWGLVGELSDQLSTNRALVTQLKSRSDNVKGQAAHAGAGFPLRRFNLDISNEEFQTELEAFSSHLVLENQQLQNENKQLNALLKEYEQTLETVMGKFRGVAHVSQQHDLSLHSYYTSLLQQLQTAHSSAQLHDSTSLSTLLTRLSTLLRSALRSLGGEETDLELASQLPGLIDLVNDHTSSIQAQAQGTPPSPTRSTTSSGKGKPFPRAPTKPVRFPGFVPGSSGGYNGTEGQGDWALEREMEIMRLEEENKALREMLAISAESEIPALPDPEEGEDQANGSTSPSEERSRKSSLTVEELELGAAEEADHKEKLKEMMGRGPAGKSEETWEEHPAGQAGTDKETKPVRSPMSESVLGFETDTPPPEEAIVDEPDAEASGPNLE